MLELKIVTPERIVFDGEVQSVLVPGVLGEFEILQDHAPIISTLGNGVVKYVDKLGTQELKVSGGVVEVQQNVVSLCVEVDA